MCGISLFVIDEKSSSSNVSELYKCCYNISHRGPDVNIIENFKVGNTRFIVSFNRLMINDLSIKGNQPFKYTDENRTVYCMCNGEIYNSDLLCEIYNLSPTSNSDCEPLMLYYLKYGFNSDLLNFLNSEHVCLILEINKNGTYKILINTDRFGIRPLFVGIVENNVYLSSELIGLPEDSRLTITRFPASHLATIENGDITYERYYNLRNTPKIQRSFWDTTRLFKANLSEAVKIRLKTDREFGAFLSGGIDSVSVCYEASQILKSQGKRLKTFSIGLPGSEDEIYAKIAAEFIDSEHIHFVMSKDEYISTAAKLVKYIGSFDTTSIRACIGQYKCSEQIATTTDVKVLLCGDFSDELNFSYNDAFDCPSNELFEDQTFNLLENIDRFDGLRADRCTAQFGLEIRIPFADPNVINIILESDVNHRVSRNRISKPLLRYAYKDILPDELAFRPKVTFSDGVGSREDQSQQLISKAFEDFYSEMEFMQLSSKYEYHCKPRTKEELFYRETFHKCYGDNESIAKTIPYFWMPRFKQSIDPSAWFNEEL